jgi:hypothetical protein|tara:strand:+ start:138 stop:281 length:144 start_codon:yes stop_codon:yes gene_type:complete
MADDISIENMAKAYIEERRVDLENMQVQVTSLEEHIKECERILENPE